MEIYFPSHVPKIHYVRHVGNIECRYLLNVSPCWPQMTWSS